jgi:hypothetical protein
MQNEPKILVQKPECKLPFGSPACKWEDNSDTDVWVMCVFVWLDTNALGQCPIGASFSTHRNELSDYVKVDNFLFVWARTTYQERDCSMELCK